MAVIRLTIAVDDITTVLTLFDKIKVYRSTTGISGTYTELTTVGTRIDLVSGTSVYTFDDTAGDSAYYYKTSYFHSTTTLESSLSDAIQGDVDPLYISIDDIRDEGVTTTQASDARVLMLIRTFQQIIERFTRNWFVPRQMTYLMDGPGSTLLQMPHPIISITSLHINGDFVNAVDTDSYEVYNGRGSTERDDRRNPRLKLISGDTSIFTGVGPVRRNTALFDVGEKNQQVIGTFGFTESDGCVPGPITYALKKLVIRNVPKMGTTGAISTPGGPVLEEWTDRHRRRYADVIGQSKAFSVTGTGDSEVDAILAAYRAPFAMRSPRTMFRRLTGGQIVT